MNPTFLDFELPVIGHVTFPAYMTMLMIGFIAAIVLARRHGEQIGLDGDRVFDLGILMLILGIVGSRLLAVLTDGELSNFINLCIDPSEVRGNPERDCLAVFKFWQGGLTYYGGFLLAVPGGLWYARRCGMPVWKVADVAAPAIMLGLFFGRLGCFFGGCCYGAPTDSWLGVDFPRLAQPAHPTQLYEAFGALALLFALHFGVRPRKRAHGEVFAWLLVLYGVMRFAIEDLRADQRGSLGPLSTSQIISLPLVAVGAWMLWRLRARAAALGAEPEDDAAPEADATPEPEAEATPPGGRPAGPGIEDGVQ